LPKITGGRAAIEAAKANGAEAVFGIPGIHNLAMYDALIDSGLKHYVTRHEQGAGFMADGYARATGRAAVCMPITGPGLTNAATPIAQAFSDSSPMLVLASQIESDIADSRKGTLHELKNQLAFMEQITEWAERASDPADCARLVHKAFSWFRFRRPRPIHIEVPMDVQAEEAEVTIDASSDKPEALTPDERDLERASQILKRASNVVIYAGGGASSSGAGIEILKLSEMLGAPVITTCQGKGCVPDDHPNVLGNTLMDARVQQFLSDCDATLAVGTHFGASNTQSWTAKIPTPIVHIDIDESEFDRNYQAEVSIRSDAKTALTRLIDCMGPVSRESRLSELSKLKADILQAQQKEIPWEIEHLNVMRECLGREGILVCDMTFMSYQATRYYPTYEPRTFLFPRGFGTLGFSPPAAMGAKIGCPDKRVISVVGDGGFLFTCTELATAAHYNIPIVIVLVNSNSYEVVKRSQARRFGEHRTIDVEVKNPDFIKLAESFGIWATRAACVRTFEKALGEAVAQQTPALIEIPFAPRGG